MIRRHGRRLVPAFFAMALVAGCAPPDLTASYELSGYVSERFESGMMLSPIEGVTMTFTSDTGLSTATTTDSSGRYRLRIESDTVFGTITATHPMFAPRTETVYFDTPIRRIDMDLRRPRS